MLADVRVMLNNSSSQALNPVEAAQGSDLPPLATKTIQPNKGNNDTLARIDPTMLTAGVSNQSNDHGRDTADFSRNTLMQTIGGKATDSIDEAMKNAPVIVFN